MKKIDKLFKEFPEWKIIGEWVRNIVFSKKRHSVKNIYKRYTQRKPKYFNEAIDIINKKDSDWTKTWWACHYIEHYYGGTALLEYLNRCFSRLKGFSGFGKLLSHLKNPDQFWATISEIEFNAYFSKRYPLVLEPKIYYAKNKFKDLDAKIKVTRRDIYFEIFTPWITKKLGYNKVITLENRSKNKFLDKLDKQIKFLKDKIKDPIVLVVNCSYSDIDELDIENSVLGQHQITIVTDKKTREVVDTFESRKNNSLVDDNLYASMISAIIVYKRFIRPWGIEFKKEIILNKKTDFPLDTKEYKALMRFDLRKI